MTNYLSFLRLEARWLAFGLLMSFISSLGQTYFISLFGAEIRTDLGLSHSAFGSYYALSTVAGGLLLMWFGRYIDHMQLRVYTGLTLAGLVGAGICLSIAQGPLTLLLAVLLLRMCGQGLSYHIAMTSMARWFARNRGKAISIANLGMPIGEALLPIIVVATLAATGWREAWWLYCLILACVFLPAALSIIWNGERKPRSAAESVEIDDVPSWSRADVLRDARFWWMLPAVVGPSWIFTGVFFHQVAIIDEKGWDFSAFAIAYLAYAFFKVGLSLVTGVLVDRFSARRIAPIAMPIMSVALVVLIIFDHPLGSWLFMSILGFHVGMQMTSVSALWPELYGRRHLGSVKSFVASLGVISSAIGPPVFGLFLDFAGGTTPLLWFCVAYGLAASAMMYFALHTRPAEFSPQA